MRWVIFFFVMVGLAIVHARYIGGLLSRAVALGFPRLATSAETLRKLSTRVFIAGIVAWTVYQFASWGLQTDGEDSVFFTLADWVVIYPFWFVMILSFQMTLLCLPVDLVGFLLHKLGVRIPATALRGYGVAVVSLFVVFAVAIPISIVQASHSMELRTHDYALVDSSSEASKALDGMRIVVLSDPQADRYTGEQRIGEMVAAANAVNPDLVLIAGDIITRNAYYIDTAARALGKLKAKYGVFACVGDHDNFAYRDRQRSAREVKEGLAKVGIPFLANHIEKIKVGDASISLVLLSNNYISRMDRELADRLFQNAQDTDLQIALAHQSSDPLIESAIVHGIDLFVSGHTHGGQVNFWTPLGDFNMSLVETSYVTGRFDFGPMTMIVSSGLGMSVTPVRYRAPATVDLVTLRAPKTHGEAD